LFPGLARTDVVLSQQPEMPWIELAIPFQDFLVVLLLLLVVVWLARPGKKKRPGRIGVLFCLLPHFRIVGFNPGRASVVRSTDPVLTSRSLIARD
jgi:hypothetical protein